MTKPNPKKPFKVICTNCHNEIEVVDESKKKFSLEEDKISVWGSAFYDSALLYIDCKCGNEIEL